MRELIALGAQIDQLDCMLVDMASALHELASKTPNEWSVKDIKLIQFSLHAATGRALYLQIQRDLDEF